MMDRITDPPDNVQECCGCGHLTPLEELDYYGLCVGCDWFLERAVSGPNPTDQIERL